MSKTDSRIRSEVGRKLNPLGEKSFFPLKVPLMIRKKVEYPLFNKGRDPDFITGRGVVKKRALTALFFALLLR